MKKIFLFFGLLVSSYSNSQELMNFYIESSGLNEVNLHTLVYNNTFSSFGSFDINTVDNTITVTLCYLNTSGQSPIYDFQENTINLPNGYSTYTINIELYGDNDALQPCSLENLVDTGTITFNYPYNPTATTYIPDNVFEDYLEDLGFGDDIPYNDLVFTHRIVNKQLLFLYLGFGLISGEVVNMEGLQDFLALKELWCNGNLITNLDTSNNLFLERLVCSNNPISQLNLSNNVNLNWLWAWEMELTNLDLTNNVNLERLDISENAISTIDLSQNSNLKNLRLSSNQFENIDVSNNSLLEVFLCGNNLITSLDVSNNPNLLNLNISFGNITNLDFSNNNLIEILSLRDNFLTNLNISNLNNLRRFDCWNNQITTLDFSFNPQLELVSVYNNNLTSLNIKNGNNSNIETFYSLNNDDLYCIDVDDEDAANNGEFPYSDWNVDDQVVFSEDCSLGLETFLENKIILYPNPAKETLFIENNSTYKLIYLKIYDITGKLVLHQDFQNNKIDISNLKTGLFFISIITDNGSLFKKFIKE